MLRLNRTDTISIPAQKSRKTASGRIIALYDQPLVSFDAAELTLIEVYSTVQPGISAYQKPECLEQDF